MFLISAVQSIKSHANKIALNSESSAVERTSGSSTPSWSQTFALLRCERKPSQHCPTPNSSNRDTFVSQAASLLDDPDMFVQNQVIKNVFNNPQPFDCHLHELLKLMQKRYFSYPWMSEQSSLKGIINHQPSLVEPKLERNFTEK